MINKVITGENNFYIKAIAIILLLNIISWAQTIKIRDIETSSPIENVRVNYNNNSFWSNTAGEVSFDNLTIGKEIVFFHIGYLERTISIDQLILDNYLIYLIPTQFYTSEVTVKTNNDKDLKNFDRKIEIENSPSLNSNSFVNIIKKKLPVFIKEYGGDEGIKTISIRGMSTENSIVLFNEIRVNSLLTGGYDFNNVDFGNFSAITFQNSTDYSNGISSPGGIINFVNKKSSLNNNLKFVTKVSSDNLKYANLQLSFPFSKLKMKLNGEFSESENRFEYIFENQKFRRNNADFSNLKLSSLLSFEEDFISLLTLYNNFHSGIPGFVVSNNFNSSISRNETENILNILSVNTYLNSKLFLTGKILQNSQKLKITDPIGELFSGPGSQKTLINNEQFLLKTKYAFSQFDLFLGYEFSYSNLTKTTDVLTIPLSEYYISQFRHELFISAIETLGFDLPFLVNNFFSSYIRYKNYKNQNSGYYFDFALGFSGNIIDEKINYKMNFSINSRIPNFSEVFYSKLISNKDLKDEKYQIFDINVSSHFSLPFNTFVSVSYFYIQGYDKIIWIPSRLAFQTPINLGKIKSDGVEILINSEIINSIFWINLNYSYNDARNRSEYPGNENVYNKIMVYSPKNKINIELILDLFNFNIGFSTFYSDKVFYTDDNTASNNLEQYFISDFSISYKHEIFQIKNHLSFSIMNVFNKSYFIVQSYPMPLRNYVLSYSLEI